MIKLFLTDVDGVLTDSGMYYSAFGDELKKFSTYDGMAMELLRNRGIKTGIITSEDTEIVKNRAKKMQIDFVFQGVKNKLEIAKKLCNELKIDLASEVAYIGDDLNDLSLLTAVKIIACPSNATEAIKSIPNIYLCRKSGGEGAVREFVDLILNGEN